MSPTRKMRVIVVDDQGTGRLNGWGLAPRLKELGDVELVGMADDKAETMRLCAQEQPDIALINLSMLKMDGITATRFVTQNYPGIQVIGITSNRVDNARVQSALNAGAVVCVYKWATNDELDEAIQAVTANQCVS